jgi:hypothetical protein
MAGARASDAVDAAEGAEPAFLGIAAPRLQCRPGRGAEAPPPADGPRRRFRHFPDPADRGPGYGG